MQMECDSLDLLVIACQQQVEHPNYGLDDVLLSFIGGFGTWKGLGLLGFDIRLDRPLDNRLLFLLLFTLRSWSKSSIALCECLTFSDTDKSLWTISRGFLDGKLSPPLRVSLFMPCTAWIRDELDRMSGKLKSSFCVKWALDDGVADGVFSELKLAQADMLAGIRGNVGVSLWELCIELEALSRPSEDIVSLPLPRNVSQL